MRDKLPPNKLGHERFESTIQLFGSGIYSQNRAINHDRGGASYVMGRHSTDVNHDRGGASYVMGRHSTDVNHDRGGASYVVGRHSTDVNHDRGGASYVMGRYSNDGQFYLSYIIQLLSVCLIYNIFVMPPCCYIY